MDVLMKRFMTDLSNPSKRRTEKLPRIECTLDTPVERPWFDPSQMGQLTQKSLAACARSKAGPRGRRNLRSVVPNTASRRQRLGQLRQHHSRPPRMVLK